MCYYDCCVLLCNNMLTTLLSCHAIHILLSSFFPLLSIQLSLNICFVVTPYRGKFMRILCIA